MEATTSCRTSKARSRHAQRCETQSLGYISSLYSLTGINTPTHYDATSLFTSVQCLDWLGRLGGHEGWFSRDPLPVFSADGPCEQFWHRQGCPLFDVVHPAFSLLTTAMHSLQGALKDGFGKAVMASDMPKALKFPSLFHQEITSLYPPTRTTTPGLTHLAEPVGPGLAMLWDVRHYHFISLGGWRKRKEKKTLYRQ